MGSAFGKAFVKCIHSCVVISVNQSRIFFFMKKAFHCLVALSCHCAMCIRLIADLMCCIVLFSFLPLTFFSCAIDNHLRWLCIAPQTKLLSMYGVLFCAQRAEIAYVWNAVLKWQRLSLTVANYYLLKWYWAHALCSLVRERYGCHQGNNIDNNNDDGGGYGHSSSNISSSHHVWA